MQKFLRWTRDNAGGYTNAAAGQQYSTAEIAERRRKYEAIEKALLALREPFSGTTNAPGRQPYNRLSTRSLDEKSHGLNIRMKTCAYCGRENDDAAVRCHECGTDEFKGHKPVEVPPQAEAPTENLPRSQPTSPPSTWLSDFIPRGNSKACFVLAMVCYSLALSSFVSALARVFHMPPAPAGYLSFGSPAVRVTMLLLIAPLIESLLLVAVVELAKLVRAPTWFQVSISALLIAASHSTTWRPHGFIVAPGFAIQAAAYCYWSPASRKTGYGVVVLIHALCNLVPAMLTIARAIHAA